MHTYTHTDIYIYIHCHCLLSIYRHSSINSHFFTCCIATCFHSSMVGLSNFCHSVLHFCGARWWAPNCCRAVAKPTNSVRPSWRFAATMMVQMDLPCQARKYYWKYHQKAGRIPNDVIWCGKIASFQSSKHQGNQGSQGSQVLSHTWIDEFLLWVRHGYGECLPMPSRRWLHVSRHCRWTSHAGHDPRPFGRPTPGYELQLWRWTEWTYGLRHARSSFRLWSNLSHFNCILYVH